MIEYDCNKSPNGMCPFCTNDGPLCDYDRCGFEIIEETKKLIDDERIDVVLTRAADILRRASDEVCCHLDDITDKKLLDDLEYIIPEIYLCIDRVPLVALIAASVGDVALPTIDAIYDVENDYKIPYDKYGDIDTEKVYNDIDFLASEVKDHIDD